MIARAVPIQVAIVVVFLAVWQYAGTRSAYADLVFSSPVAVAGQLGEWGRSSARWMDLLLTFQEALVGYVLGALAACVMVTCFSAVPFLDRFFSPFITTINALPKIVLAPLFIVWFGISFQSKIVFVAVAIFFIIFYNLLAGLQSVDPVFVTNIRALGGSTLDVVIQVYVPAVFGWLMASLRLSVAWALLSAIISEYLGSTQGVGHLIAQGEQALRSSAVLAGVLVIAIVSLGFDRALGGLEHHYAKWRLF